MLNKNGLSPEAKRILIFLNDRCDVVTLGSIARGLHPHDQKPDLPSDNVMNALVNRGFVENLSNGFLLTPEGEKFCQNL